MTTAVYRVAETFIVSEWLIPDLDAATLNPEWLIPDFDVVMLVPE